MGDNIFFDANRRSNYQRIKFRARGGTGRHTGLRNQCSNGRVSLNLTEPTNNKQLFKVKNENENSITFIGFICFWMRLQ